jgi:soluble lytic murein transglycosylase-like protein
MLPSMLPNRPEEAKTLADSLTVKRLKMAPDGRGVLIEIKVPPSFARPQQEERIAGLWQQQQQRRLERWDAFLTFAIKSLARRNDGPERKKILAALLNARYAIAQMQVDDSAGGSEALPQLFTQTWEQVRAATLEAAAGTVPGRKAQNITSFVSAADVAVSLSQEGQDSGIELSDDSLRMISRKLDPQTAEDPVSYSTAVDPELRNMLGFGDPLPAPSIPSDFAESAVTPLLQRLQYLLSVPEALAETDAYATLKRWAPNKNDVATYLPLVRQLLADTANEALARKNLDPRYHDLYRTTVLATAWQESCWRQFTMKGNKLAVITSPNGTSVGIMQINQKVWRGIYDPAGLSGDIVYNARAGSEILLHYLRDYALEKKEHLQPGGDLAQACYAAYNAGPGRLARYRMPGTGPAEKKIDALWLRRYTALRDDRQAEAAECF